MIILPIVSRELRVAARRPATYWTRFSAAVFTVLLASWIILVMRNVPSARVGAALFSALSVLLFAFCLLAGVANTADCMAEEKREGTLGLLFLTDLRGFDVVLGKFAANSMTSVYGLLAAAPVLALPLLLGGVAPQAFWQMVLHLLNALFFSLSAGMLVSSLSSDSRRAVIGTFFLVLAFAGGLPLAGWLDASFIGQTQTGLAPAYLLPSPGYGFSLALEGAFRARATSPIWSSFLIVHLLGWSFLATSTLIVPRTWKDRPATVRGTRLRDWWRHWAYGNPVQRRSFRAQSLEANPISWLGARYRPKRVLVWVFLGGAGVVWLWGYIRLRHDWLNAGVGIWVMFLAHTVMKYWVALEAGRLFYELRRNGSFELLLSTPIKIPEILAGQLLGLRFQFGAPILLLLLADAVLLVFGLKNESGDFSERRDIALVYAAIMGMLIMDYFALAWVGMWHGLCARRIQRAVSATLSIVLLFPWLVFIGTVIMYGVLRLDRIYEAKTPIPLFLWWFAIGATIDWLAIAWARSRLEGQFRHRVAEQFSAPRRRWWRP